MFVDLQKVSHLLISIENHSFWNELVPERIDFNRFVPEQIDFNRVVPERGCLNLCKYGCILMGVCGFGSW